MERGVYFDRDYREVVTELYERGVNRRDPLVVETLVAPDVVVHRLDTGEVTRGRESFVQERAAWLDAVPDYQVRIEDVVTDVDRAVVRLTCYGTPVKPFESAQPTGRSFAVSALHEVRFEDGKIAEAWLLDDRMAMVRQLGLLPGSVGDVLRVAGHRLRWLLFGRPRTARGKAPDPDGEVPTRESEATASPRNASAEAVAADEPETGSQTTRSELSDRATARVTTAETTVNKDSEVIGDEPGREAASDAETEALSARV